LKESEKLHFNILKSVEGLNFFTVATFLFFLWVYWDKNKGVGRVMIVAGAFMLWKKPPCKNQGKR
jgi:hypothetical protein